MREPAIRALALALFWMAAHGPAVYASGDDEDASRTPAAMIHVDAGRTDQKSFFGAVSAELETAHHRIGRGWDAALGFTGGWQPLLTMVKTADSGSIASRYVDGLTTSVAVRFAHASGSTETAVTGHVGTAHVSLAPTVDDGVQAAPAANEIGPWAAFFDVTADVRWYPRDAQKVHRTTQSLDWMVHVFATAKHDQRFHRAGDLGGFNDPTGRIVLGLDAYPIRVTDARSADARTWLNAGGGFQYEAAIRSTDRLPSGWRAMLSANLDLVTVLRRARH